MKQAVNNDDVNYPISPQPSSEQLPQPSITIFHNPNPNTFIKQCYPAQPPELCSPPCAHPSAQQPQLQLCFPGLAPSAPAPPRSSLAPSSHPQQSAKAFTQNQQTPHPRTRSRVLLPELLLISLSPRR